MVDLPLSHVGIFKSRRRLQSLFCRFNRRYFLRCWWLFSPFFSKSCFCYQTLNTLCRYLHSVRIFKGPWHPSCSGELCYSRRRLMVCCDAINSINRERLFSFLLQVCFEFFAKTASSVTWPRCRPPSLQKWVEDFFHALSSCCCYWPPPQWWSKDARWTSARTKFLSSVVY